MIINLKAINLALISHTNGPTRWSVWLLIGVLCLYSSVEQERDLPKGRGQVENIVMGCTCYKIHLDSLQSATGQHRNNASQKCRGNAVFMECDQQDYSYQLRAVTSCYSRAGLLVPVNGAIIPCEGISTWSRLMNAVGECLLWYFWTPFAIRVMACSHLRVARWVADAV